MHVSIVETRHHELSMQIDDLRLRRFQWQHFCFTADRNQPVPTDSHRLGPLHRMKRGITVHPGINVRVNVNGVGDWPRGSLCHQVASEGDCYEEDKNCKEGPQIHFSAPANARLISRIRASPNALPEGSNHSCSV